MILEKAMNDFMKTAFPNVSSWNGYSKESWYFSVVRMDTTFDNIQKVDSLFGKKINELAEKAKGLDLQIRQRK